MSNFITISASIIPGILPNGYVDKRYTTLEPIKMGMMSKEYITDAMYATIYDTFVENRSVQVVLYDKYKWKLPMQEHDNLELIQYADLVTIAFQSGLTYKAKLTSVNISYVEGTRDRWFECEFIDINPANYNEYKQQVSNKLRSDTLLARYTAAQLYYISTRNFDNTKDKVYYTAIVPTLETKEIILKSEQINGVEKITRQVLAQGYNVRLYLNEADANDILTYSKTSFNIGDSIGYCYLVRPSLSPITAPESIVPEVKKIDQAVDLYEVNVFFKISTIEYNPYE